MAYYAETGRFRPPNRLTLWITLICTRYSHYFLWLAITIGPSDSISILPSLAFLLFPFFMFIMGDDGKNN